MRQGKQLGQRPDEYRGTSPEAIQYHYDIGNDFYRLWLDKTLTYSCALWEEDEGYDALETAQRRKIEYHIRQARADNAKRVLDVGCGWGGILRALVEEHNVEHGIGLTLSKAGVEWIEALGIPQIEARLEDWLDHKPVEPYDAIIAVGVLEHAVRQGCTPAEKAEAYRTFFKRCHRWLKPKGWMSLQTIVYGNARAEEFSRFFADEVYPESDLARLPEIALGAEHIFEIVTLRNDRFDYARTCRAWLKRLKANRVKAVNVAGESIVERYEEYLRLSMLAFEAGSCDLLRITLRRIDKPRQ